jgi:hypothetical protein|tara:strand:- start:73 stop:291 length:219 start_codon:yes stop_codon:yes gene_type:complete
MLSKQFANLSEDDLRYMETLLSREFTAEQESNKNWISRNKYEKPMHRVKQILNCMNAIKSQRELKNTLSVKW